jgi:hypothetical protein
VSEAPPDWPPPELKPRNWSRSWFVALALNLILALAVTVLVPGELRERGSSHLPGLGKLVLLGMVVLPLDVLLAIGIAVRWFRDWDKAAEFGRLGWVGYLIYGVFFLLAAAGAFLLVFVVCLGAAHV